MNLEVRILGIREFARREFRDFFRQFQPPKLLILLEKGLALWREDAVVETQERLNFYFISVNFKFGINFSGMEQFLEKEINKPLEYYKLE